MVNASTIEFIVAIILIVIVLFLLFKKKAPTQPSQDAQPPLPKPVSAEAPPDDETAESEETSAPIDVHDDDEEDDEDDESPNGEITMMGRVPDEVLEMMKGTLKADEEALKEPEEDEAQDDQSTDIDVDSLVDETEQDEVTETHALILVVGVARSDRGRKRKSNEDAFLVVEDKHVFVVADGMGGHNAGDVASQTAVEEMKRAFKTGDFQGEVHPEWPQRGDELVRAIHMANTRVFEKSQEKDEYSGMGTTIVSIRFSPNKQRAYIAHVGDSRCYRLRDGELNQLTEDHTLGNLIGAKGPMAKHLAQAVGVRPDVAVDLAIDQPEPGDYYLVCSDGLTKMVPNEVIQDMLLHPEGDLEQQAQALIQEANDRGGRDNITVILVQVGMPSHASAAK